MTSTFFDERAQEGAQYLDDCHPNWWIVVNADTLDMGNHMLCVLAQLAGDYMIGAERYGIYDWADRVTKGFTLPNYSNHQGSAWASLTEAWKRQLHMRSN